MVCFPKTIECTLQNGGFTGVEQLLLRHILTDEPSTLRELAHRTGKSTGALDRAMKKLLMRGVAERVCINEQQKYTCGPAEHVVNALAGAFQTQRKHLERQESEVRRFFGTLRTVHTRPRIEHVHGAEEISELLVRLAHAPCEGDMLHILPQPHCEDDTISGSAYEYFSRQRRKVGRHARVLVPPTCAGKRFRERDVLRLRTTRFLPEDSPMTFVEKLIVGDMFATVHHREHTGMLLRNADLAHAERIFFEALWTRSV